MEKNPKGLLPEFSSNALIIILGVVATSVIMPLIIPANATGIRSLEGDTFNLWQRFKVIGRNIAIIGDDHILVPNNATESISQTIAPATLCPDFA